MSANNDFNLHKSLSFHSRYTSIAYRAPEMVDLYKNLEISTKADIWALGCLLYTLCFLKLPFKDSLLAIQSGEYSIPDDSIYCRNLRKLIGKTFAVLASVDAAGVLLM